VRRAPQLNSQLDPGLGVIVPVRQFAPGLHPSLMATAPAPKATSTGEKVAIGTAAVAGTSILTIAIISAATGWGITKVLDHAWDGIRGKKSR